MNDKYRSRIVEGRTYWFVPQSPLPQPHPPGGPTVAAFPRHLVPYITSSSCPKAILEPNDQPFINNLHQYLWGTKLIDGDLTPQVVRETVAQEQFDIAETGAYKVVTES